MYPIRVSGPICAVAVFGLLAGSMHAGECEATVVCWHRCPSASCYEPAPCCCGPIRRLLGLCRPRPVAVCPACVPPCPVVAPPSSCCPGAVPAVPPASGLVPGGQVPNPSALTPNEELRPAPPVTGSSYQPRPLPVRVPARPLTPSSAPRPIPFDRVTSFPRLATSE
jgi:hypothetical protein